MAKAKIQSLRGMYDLLPEAARNFEYLSSVFTDVTTQAGYGLIKTPILEETSLFSRGVGAETDIVSKEMYSFNDKSDTSVTMRAEATAPIVRAYLEHGLASQPQPVRLYTVGPYFRYERPQAGRQRQFHQLGVEVFGEIAASIDAQVISLGLRYFRRLRLPGVTLQINSIGDAVCRPKYRKALVEYLTDHESKLGEVDRERLKTNPLRVLDSKDPGTKTVLVDVPQTLNYLCDACREHFASVLEYLDAMGVSYELNPLLVRGLDYYNRTVFEYYGEREGAQSALGGGGRYDGLVEELGGAPTPAFGFGLGLERLLLETETAGVLPVVDESKRVYVVSLGEPARMASFGLIEKLLDAGIAATGSVDRDGIGGQLARASKLGVPYAIIMGQKEIKEGTVLLRDMANGAQETLPEGSIVADLARRFA